MLNLGDPVPDVDPRKAAAVFAVAVLACTHVLAYSHGLSASVDLTMDAITTSHGWRMAAEHERASKLHYRELAAGRYAVSEAGVMTCLGPHMDRAVVEVGP